MSETVSLWKRPLARIAAFSFAAMFIMAPTPGNVGGCSSVAGSQPVQPGNPSIGETAEYMYFDHGMCAGFCWRLRECSVLCSVLNPAHPDYDAACGTGPGAGNDSPAAFNMCVRATSTPDGRTPFVLSVFGIASCPHACPAGAYHTAYEWDVQACSDAVIVRSCNQGGPGSIGDTYREGVAECTNVCR
ncbi:MAG: hypothetical protein WCJ30_03355 [Deltaproteobacteria bacterium]